MFVNTFFKRFVFNLVMLLICIGVSVLLFHPIYTANTVIFPFALHPFNICEEYPEAWEQIKLFYVVISFISSLIWINLLYNSIFSNSHIEKKKKSKVASSELSLSIANSNLESPIILPEASLYQNILVTGTIGSGKTSSAMYPFTRQLIKYKYENPDEKLGLLVLDVKGNYYAQVKKYASYYRREDDLVIIELRWFDKI